MDEGISGNLFPEQVATFTGICKKRRRDYWRRVISLRKIGWKWFLVIILLFPVMGGIAYLIHLAAGGNSIRLDPESYGSIGSFLLFAVFIFIGGPLGEELGWRGFLLERLQRRWKPLTSSLVLGIVWIIWHFPLFFIPGTAQYSMEFLSHTFFQWAIQVMCLSIILSWVFNNTGGSILSAVLIHFMTNFTITSLEGVDGRLSRVMGLTVTILHVLVVIFILFYKKGMRKGYT